MGSSNKKVEAFVNEQQAARMLRDLADLIEDGGREVGDDMALAGLEGADFSKLSVRLKRKESGISIKVKAKLPADVEAEEAEDAERSRPKYSTLKKQMKGEFKAISRSVIGGHFPQVDIVQAFIEDSELMVTYPGQGDEYYAAYDDAMEEFRKAYQARDLTGLKAACFRLDAVKKQCHDVHK